LLRLKGPSGFALGMTPFLEALACGIDAVSQPSLSRETD
jgi:hypothetical protein